MITGKHTLEYHLVTTPMQKMATHYAGNLREIAGQKIGESVLDGRQYVVRIGEVKVAPDRLDTLTIDIFIGLRNCDDAKINEHVWPDDDEFPRPSEPGWHVWLPPLESDPPGSMRRDFEYMASIDLWKRIR